MIIYLSGFIVSIIIILYVQKKPKNNMEFIIGSLIALLIPCLIAALRNENIGTDVQVYVKPLYNAAVKASNLKEYYATSWRNIWTNTYVVNFEFGFSFMVYLVAKLFGNFSILLFIIQLLIIVPIYKAAIYHRDKSPVWLTMIVFYFMYYNMTLNVMRQWIAMAILLYALQYMIENRKVKYCFCVFFAFLFHKSALIGVVIWILYKYCNNKKIDPKIKIIRGVMNANTYKLFIITCFGIGIIISQKLLILLLNIFGMSRYTLYFSGLISFSGNQILLRLPIIILFVLLWNKMQSNNPNATFWAAMFIFDLFTSQFFSITSQSGRFGLLFAEYGILSYPQLCTCLKLKNNRIIIKFVLISYIILYWCYYYIVGNIGATIPYISIFG